MQKVQAVSTREVSTLNHIDRKENWLNVAKFNVLFHNDNYPGRPSMDILVRSWQDLAKILEKSCQDLGKILAKFLPRHWQELQDLRVRSYQESHVPKKTFIVKSYLERNKSGRSKQKSTFLQIYIVGH